MARKTTKAYKKKDGTKLWKGIVYCTECNAARYRGRCNGHSKGLCGFTTELEAHHYAVIRQAEIFEGRTAIPSQDMTLNEVADHFFRNPRPGSVGERTFKWYRRNWDARIRGTIGCLAVNRIGPLDVTDWLNDLATGNGIHPGLSKSSMRSYLITLNRCGFKHAISKMGIKISNPTLSVELPSPQSLPTSTVVEFTRDQIWALAGAIAPRYRLLVLLGAFHGFRIGELAGLREDDIEFIEHDNVIIHVRGQVQDGRIIPPKTVAGRRTVPVSLPLRSEIRDHLENFPPSENEHRVLFPSPTGALFTYGNFRRRVWLPALAEANIRECGTHSMRHTAIKLHKKAGVPLHIIGELLGQKDLGVTLHTYGRGVDREDLIDAIDRLTGVWKAKAFDASPFGFGSPDGTPGGISMDFYPLGVHPDPSKSPMN